MSACKHRDNVWRRPENLATVVAFGKGVRLKVRGWKETYSLLFALLCDLNCLLRSRVTYKIGEGGMEGRRKRGRERRERLSSVSLEPR